MQLKVQDFSPSSENQSPMLVFLHGWGVNCGVFEGLLPFLEEEHTIRFIDLPGFGSNAHLDISHLEFAQFCQLVEQQIPNNAILIGWSLGGLVAQQIASSENAKTNKIVLICTSPFFMQENTCWYGIKPNVLEGFQTQLSSDFKKTLERFLAIQSLGSDTARSDLKKIKTQIFQYDQPREAALRKGLEYLQNIDLRDLVGAEKTQTLRIFGSQDSLVPKKAIEKIKQLDPNGHYELIKGASHAPFISHTADFITALKVFL